MQKIKITSRNKIFFFDIKKKLKKYNKKGINMASLLPKLDIKGIPGLREDVSNEE
jgi:hypothetical protein